MPNEHSDHATPGQGPRRPVSDDFERAEEVVEEAESRGEDRETIREAIEGELEDAGLSEEGGHIGQHID